METSRRSILNRLLLRRLFHRDDLKAACQSGVFFQNISRYSACVVAAIILRSPRERSRFEKIRRVPLFIARDQSMRLVYKQNDWLCRRLHFAHHGLKPAFQLPPHRGDAR